ncbi:hypothetical protein FQN55_009480 [Onygenales sp. PD_40]|nr:hypothetical protein FQN55_009480 [Onygenales sp. PD_40]KAK2775004.1 hypothetical protein FQN53_003353 [Emmonsiellopsis sp. PD_33]KAK2794212.1 hypothetical protein FQN51_000913 [Onygenales sp. PD_10]
MDSLASRVYAITGISGIGLGVAKHLLSHGALISIADISQSALDTAVATLNASPDVLLATVVDVGSASQVNDWIDATVAKFGRLDGAANMAGVIGKHHGIRNLADQDDDQWDLLVRVNLTGVMYCMRAQLRAIAKKGDAGEGKGKGSIVNAASIQGVIGFEKHAAYSATKHGVIGLSKSTAREVAPDVRVNCVAP